MSTPIDGDASITATSLVERARALIPILREGAHESNALRRVPDKTVEEFAKADLLHLLKPQSAGGPEVRFDQVLDIAGELARGDGSAAWVWMVTASHDLMAAHFCEQAQREIWAKPGLSAASVTPGGQAKPTNGGATLSGKWPFCSGSPNADWMLLAATANPSGSPSAPDACMLMVPIGDCRILDDWNVLGLRGTGSHTVIVANVFVPEHRIVTFEQLARGNGPGAARHRSPLYRAPLWSIFPFVIAATAAGIARGAWECFVDEKTKADATNTVPLARRVGMELRVAEAGALIDAADLLFKRAAGETVEKIMAGEPLSLELRLRNRRDQAYSVMLAKRAVELLMAAEGGRGLYEGGVTQRAFRDLQAVSAHIAVGWEGVALNYGQVMLGGQPLDQMF